MVRAVRNLQGRQLTRRPRLFDRRVIGALAVELAVRGAPFRFVAHGGSMLPSVRSGSELVIQPCVAADIQAGAIVAVLHQGALVIHRAVALRDGTLVMWGDGLATPDGPLSLYEVIGRVVDVRPPSPILSAWRALRQRAAAMRGER